MFPYRPPWANWTAVTSTGLVHLQSGWSAYFGHRTWCGKTLKHAYDTYISEATEQALRQAFASEAPDLWPDKSKPPRPCQRCLKAREREAARREKERA